MDINFPNPPANDGYYRQQPAYAQQSYTTNGRPAQIETIPPTSSYTGSLGANFSGLIGSNVTVPAEIITEKSNTKKKKKKEVPAKTDDNSTPDTTSSVANSKEVVESTIYADTYQATNRMTLNVIGQADELLRESKQDLDFIRSQRNLKGRYHYINATLETMSSLMSTKLSAIKEINNTIKNANDAEYRRFKDMRAMDNTDDNKLVQDTYRAFISLPVGSPQYQQPTTMSMTSGLDGIIRADYPADVQKQMDAGLSNYLSNLTPEENLMLNDSNPDIEEVLVYDEATGAKYFQWMNTKTNQPVPNMPPSSNLAVEDYTIDPRTKIARNNNLNSTKKVIVKNEGSFNRF